MKIYNVDKEKVLINFWKRVDTLNGFATNEDCWLWIGSIRNTYGGVAIGDKVFYAHRIAYMLYKGEILNKLQVLHKCDSPLCVNPNHLYLGTQKENIKDSVSKGRHSSVNQNLTHCRHGHLFTEESTGYYRGNRYCLRCRRISRNR